MESTSRLLARGLLVATHYTGHPLIVACGPQHHRTGARMTPTVSKCAHCGFTSFPAPRTTPKGCTSTISPLLSCSCPGQSHSAAAPLLRMVCTYPQVHNLSQGALIQAPNPTQLRGISLPLACPPPLSGPRRLLHFRRAYFCAGKAFMSCFQSMMWVVPPFRPECFGAESCGIPADQDFGSLPGVQLP